MNFIILPIFFAFVLFFNTSAFAGCGKHDELGIKDTVDQIDLVLCREGYAAGYNFYYKSPIWVAYHITKESVNGGVGRTTTFKVDDDIAADYQATNWDYKYSGYDRGHMTPSATIDFNKNSRNQSYLMSNMTPQVGSFNRNGWADLEGFVRDMANKFKEVYVVTGAVFDGDNKTIGEGVHVPSSLYKVIYIPSEKKVVAFLIKNETFNIKNLKSVQVSVKNLQKRAGLDFLRSLENSHEKKIENEKLDYCSLFDNNDPTHRACE